MIIDVLKRIGVVHSEVKRTDFVPRKEGWSAFSGLFRDGTVLNEECEMKDALGALGALANYLHLFDGDDNGQFSLKKVPMPSPECDCARIPALITLNPCPNRLCPTPCLARRAQSTHSNRSARYQHPTAQPSTHLGAQIPSRPSANPDTLDSMTHSHYRDLLPSPLAC